jgi:hypothetical protein
LTRQKTFLFFSLLILVILTQVVVFRWGAETVFFVSWLFLALVVQHDSRFSVVIGLVILAICPFLLIFNQAAAAEQAANYAYFFLAIGVIVQLEELLMERFGWLPHKVDLSYLWRPAIQGFGRLWRATEVALSQIWIPGNRTELTWPLLALGIAALGTAVFLASYRGVQFLVVIPFLVGVALFPFIVWGLHFAIRTLEPTLVMRVVLALVILPLSAMELVWLYNLVRKDVPENMTMAYDFVDHLIDGKRTSPSPDGEDIEMRVWTIGDITQPVLYQHPAFSGASRIVFTVPVVNGEVLAFNVATAPESWSLPGDGVTFAIYAESAEGTRQLFSTYIDPKNNEADRRWFPAAIDLSTYTGMTINLIFETSTGPAGDYRYDWAGWGGLRLMK